MAKKLSVTQQVGYNVWLARTRAGRTQAQLAEILWLYREAVTDLEHGDRRLTLPEAVATAAFLRCPLAKLTRGLPKTLRGERQ